MNSVTASYATDSSGNKPDQLSKRLSLTLFTDNFLPHAGGSRVYYFNLFKRMASSYGCDVTVLTKKVPGWREFDRAHSAEHFRIRRRYKPLYSINYHQIPKLIPPLIDTALFTSMHPTDVLHCGDLWPPGLAGVILKKARGLPFIAYCHGEELTQTERLRIQPKIRDCIYRSADAVIANSDFSVRALRQVGIDENRIHKITPGVDTDRIFPKQPDERLIQKHRIKGNIVLLTVGRLIDRKGQDSVIRVLGKMLPKHPDLRYLVVGKGPEEARLRKLAADIGLTEHVNFVGFVPDEELNSYYNLADIVVMPNREEESGDLEGFGMVFLEGSAAGKPVVAGRSGGAPETVVDGVTGVLVNSRDEDDIQRALEELVVNENLRKQLGQAGLKHVLGEFNWDVRAERLSKISRTISASRGKRFSGSRPLSM